MDTRYHFVAIVRTVRTRGISVLVAASAFLCLANLASGETVYSWRDAANRLHFSNRAERVPSHAQLTSLPALGIAKPRPVADDRSSLAESPPASEDASVASPSEPSECDVADPSGLIDAITSRLETMRSDGSADPGLTLIVAGTPVSYSPNADLQVLTAGETDGTAASEQGAVAYPAGGGCPRTPPLERYAVTAPVRTSSSGLCADYRRASAEIDIATSRNENVARTFEFAEARFDSSTADGEASGGVGREIELPPWLVEVGEAQTAELAVEIEEFSEELTVAREEIDRAARAQGCW